MSRVKLTTCHHFSHHLINVHRARGIFKNHCLVRVGEIYEWLEIKGADYVRNTCVEILVPSSRTSHVGVWVVACKKTWHEDTDVWTVLFYVPTGFSRVSNTHFEL
jgi:hypothetical protein